IRKDVQERLAAIRTDLDSFADVEAYALMTSGYRMTEYQFTRSITGFATPAGEPPNWHFLAVEPLMKQVAGSKAAHEEMMRLLGLANQRFFRYWRLSPLMQVFTAV